MVEKELKYMGSTIKYKEAEIPGKFDEYRRPMYMKVAKQSDAEQVTDKDSGIKKWTGGAFADMFINMYIKDEEYDEIDDETLIAMANKLGL